MLVTSCLDVACNLIILACQYSRVKGSRNTESEPDFQETFVISWCFIYLIFNQTDRFYQDLIEPEFLAEWTDYDFPLSTLYLLCTMIRHNQLTRYQMCFLIATFCIYVFCVRQQKKSSLLPHSPCLLAQCTQWGHANLKRIYMHRRQ